MAIIGGGFSGTLQAINLLRHNGPRATLVERRASAGTGLAYGQAAPSHLLNVRAKGMGAFPDDPLHFVRWLNREGFDYGPDAFVPRMTYGAYLRELLETEIARQPGRLAVVHDDAVAIDLSGAASVRLDSGKVVHADLAVLAVGNLPPHHPLGFDAELSDGLYASDPWSPAATEGLVDDDEVLLLGTGLTMVDVMLRLRSEGFAGQIIALSRRGLLPHRHDAQESFEAIRERPSACASTLVSGVRQRAKLVGWRNAVDELRPFSTQIWQAADVATRRRFVRHLRPWWDIHRHRLAPQIAEQIDRELAGGGLRVVAAATLRARRQRARLEVRIKPRGDPAEESLIVDRVINCTGPQGNLAATSEVLLRSLHEDGVIRPDALGLGIDVDAQFRTLAANGKPNENLLAIGPMTRGAAWEIVAVPDIRQQVWALARRHSNAHWVGGEGL